MTALPSEDAVMPTADVLAAYRRHRTVLEVARTDRTREDYPTLAEQALDALEAGEAVIADLRAERMEVVFDALTYGGDIEEVAVRLGWPVATVVSRVQETADLDYAMDFIDRREWRRLRRLVIGGAL